MILLIWICSKKMVSTLCLHYTALSWTQAVLMSHTVQLWSVWRILELGWREEANALFTPSSPSRFLLCISPLLSYCLSWCSALSPFHSDDLWWQPCRLLWAACCVSRWAQFLANHPGQCVSTKWNVASPLWAQGTAIRTNKQINRHERISL